MGKSSPISQRVRGTFGHGEQGFFTQMVGQRIPGSAEGVVGEMRIVEVEDEERLYVKILKGWRYITLTR